MPRSSSPATPHPAVRHAVVIGAGVGGLAAAAAVAPHAERVTVLDRDDLPDGPERRAGVPQGRHAHGLQPGGLAALDRLVPGFRAELRAAGGRPVRVAEEVLWLTAAGYVRPHDSGHHLLIASRELIEWTLRRLVVADPRIDVRSGLDVAGLVLGDGRVLGVRTRPRRAGTGAAADVMAADLVVDASGRRSPTPDWLAEAGYERPAETVIDSGLTYGTRTYRRRPGDTPGWKAALIQAEPPVTTRAGLAFPLEGDRWIVTLSGLDGDVPPTDDAGFLDFARSLRSPHLATFMAGLEPVSPVATYVRTENRRRHYERLGRRPEGLVVAGDAACAFNPIYGQGMTVAALQAEAIGRELAGGPGDGFAARAQAAIAAEADPAWQVATGVDLKYPWTTGGARGLPDRLIGRYMDRVLRAGTVDPVVNTAFFAVIALLERPESLLRPALALRVLGRRTPAPEPAPWPVVAPAPAVALAEAADV